MTTNDAPLTLAAIVGSLRAGSIHRQLFERAADLVAADVSLVEVSVGDVPFFNQDLEGPDAPMPVTRLQSAIADADGVILFSPEYNGGVPAVTKNAVDWASRPRGEAALAGKPVMVVTATPGRHGGESGRTALAHTAGGAGGRVFHPTLGMASITRRMEERQFTDPEAEAELRDALAEFVAFVRTPPPD